MKKEFNTHKSQELISNGPYKVVWIGSWKRIDVTGPDKWGGIIGGWDSKSNRITINADNPQMAKKVLILLLNGIQIVK